ncbi:hypothetical protein OQA88_10627 [Cercophora sp. LCS_1]
MSLCHRCVKINFYKILNEEFYVQRLPDRESLSFIKGAPDAKTCQLCAFFLQAASYYYHSSEPVPTGVDFALRRKHFSLDIDNFRVIDCVSGAGHIVPYPGGANDVYTALSYVWGAGSSSPAQGNALPSPVPQVIADAITVVRAMGFWYLWVDRYCLPQDKQELAPQLQKMGHIYASAVFTIIAAAGDGPEYGLAGVTTARSTHPSIRIDRCLLAPVFHPGWDIDASKWATRGWTFQVGLLSRRRLVFTQHQVFFQCAEARCLETVSTPINQTPLDYNMLSPYTRSSVHLMGNYISNYMQRDLTHQNDAHDAFRGILQHGKDMKPPVCSFYGIPPSSPNRDSTGSRRHSHR